MTDSFGRIIDYMRVSVTDRCNLRCRYCMPHGVRLAEHGDLLRYEELLRVCRLALSLGITTFKVTGGEPLVRRGCVDFIARLKEMDGVEQVTLTTNGLLLAEHLDALCAAGIDGINISLDTLQDAQYRELTGFAGDSAAVALVEQALEACVRRGLRVKVNTVLLAETFDGIADIASLAQKFPVDVRFIELMPIGEGSAIAGVPAAAALERLTRQWPDLHPTGERRGNGPAHYWAADGLRGRIGFIDAVSHMFCDSCNRVRITSTGTLKPCLCYGDGTDLRSLLRSGCGDDQLLRAMENCIRGKPQAHCFSQRRHVTEHKTMNEIGG